MNAGLRVIAATLLLVLNSSETVLSATAADPDKDPDLAELLYEIRADLDAKKPQVAIEKCEKIIAAFKAYYGNSTSQIYCAASSPESFLYLTLAAAAMNEGKFPKGKKDAITLSATWASAYFCKAYAYQDLGRLTDAKSALQLALALSPSNSRYLSELGSIYILEKNWRKAKEAFTKAEDNAPVASDSERDEVLARARRGLGYVFVELGQLDEATKKYKQCVAADPKDTRAAKELEYIHGLQQKSPRKPKKP